MKADNTVTITPALVQEWEEQADAAEKASLQKAEEAKALRARIQAATLLLGPVAGALEASEEDGDVASMIESMATIANSAEKPMTKATMKARLMTLGFPEERMGGYFYTCVARLKAKKRIRVMPDGRIWRADL